MIRFKTFKPSIEYDGNGHRLVYSATLQLNEWLEENPDVEIINWQATAVGEGDYALWITVQYKENDADEGKRVN